MKTTIFRQFIFTSLIITISILYFSCGDDSTTNSTTQTSISCISGQISGWTYGSDKTLQFKIASGTHHIYSIASCPIDSLGNFNMCLPQTLTDTALYRADSIFYSNCAGNGSVNPPDARGTQIWVMDVYSGTSFLGQIEKNNYSGSPTAGSFAAMYIYVNKNISVTGNKYCGNDTLQFNGNAVTGWNQITRNYLKVSVNGKTVLYNNTEPPGAIWRYYH